VKATPHAYALAERVTEDVSIDVRIAACGTLGNVGLGAGSVQPALASLYKAEKDPDPRVQAAAKEALEKLKSQNRPLPQRPPDDEAPTSSGGRGRGRGNSSPRPNDNIQAADNNIRNSFAAPARSRGRGRASNNVSNEVSVPASESSNRLSVPTDSQVGNARGRARGRGRGSFSNASGSNAMDFNNKEFSNSAAAASPRPGAKPAEALE